MRFRKARLGSWLPAAALALLTFGGMVEAAQIKVVSDPGNPSIAFAASDIKKALELRGHIVTQSPLSQFTAVEGEFLIVLATLADVSTKNHLVGEGGNLPNGIKAQGFGIRTTQNGTKTFWALGGDAVGAMYGGLELAKKLQVYGTEGTWNFDQNAFLENRGIKLNIAFDKRSRTYQSKDMEYVNVMIKAVWDMKFWEEYLDEMARARYNLLSLWSFHPFTVMMKVPGYENAALEDVYDYQGLIKRMTIEEKNKFWKDIHALAEARGIKVYWMVWNIYVDGALNKYGITESVDNAATRNYLRKTMTHFLQEFPTVSGFIVHAGEHYDTGDRDKRAEFIWDTFGRGTNDYQKLHDPGKNRDFTFIYRLYEGSTSVIAKYFDNLTYNYDFEIKYSWAHMYSHPAPGYHRNVKGESVFEVMKARKKKMWLNLRNDDMYYLNWGSYDFARTYILNIPQEPGDKDKSRYVPGFFMGSDGNTHTYTWYSKDKAINGMLDIKKNWYAFYAFGYAGYDPHRTDEDFKDVIRIKYPDVPTEALYKAWTAASRGLPMANTLVTADASWRADFMWYPEGNWPRSKWGSIQEWAQQLPTDGAHIPITVPAGSDWAPKGVCGFTDYKNDKCGTRETPVAWGERMKQYAMLGLQGPRSGSGKEVQLALDDVRALALLGWFYSGHIRATAHHLKGNKAKAVEAAAEAYNAWDQYAEIMDRNYTGRKHNRVSDWDNWSSKLKSSLADYHFVGGTGTPARVTAVDLSRSGLQRGGVLHGLKGKSIAFSLAEGAEYSISLRNLHGGLIRRIRGHGRTGHNSVPFASPLSPGLYLVGLETGGQTLVKQLPVLP